MYKIFIDTNIFLDFYRINSRDDVNEVIQEMLKYKINLITTQQSNDEFLRNREKTIKEFIDILKSQNSSSYSNNFIAILDGYNDYAKSIKATNSAIDLMIKNCKNIINDITLDPIYNIYSSIYDENSTYIRTAEIIENAKNRKAIGNPPTSNKNTCGDEIIWESLLTYCNDNLIIVSRDKTFKDNFSFLSNEYFRLKNKKLFVVDNINSAIKKIGKKPSIQLENIERDLVISEELVKYGFLQDSSNWINIIYSALLYLGGEANLEDIYYCAYKLVKNNYPDKLANKEMKATIRGILQRYSDQSKSSYSFFTQVKRGRWALIQLPNQL